MVEPPTIRLSPGEIALAQSLMGIESPRPCLIVYAGPEVGRRILLAEATARIGRAAGCAVHIDDPAISREHAELRIEGDRVSITDLGSVNGTAVNERKVVAPTPLADGDLVRLGHVVLKFYSRRSADLLLHDQIYRMATVDAGTDVFSKRHLMETLEREVRMAQRRESPLALICLDLDLFKAVNDRFGHLAGDRVLREAAQAAQRSVRTTDVIGRLGGEEFAVVLPATGLASARETAERIRAAVAALVLDLVDLAEPGGAAVRHLQTVSLGVAELVPGMTSGTSLLAAADARLYEAKRAGRNCVRG